MGEGIGRGGEGGGKGGGRSDGREGEGRGMGSGWVGRALRVVLRQALVVGVACSCRCNMSTGSAPWGRW